MADKSTLEQVLEIAQVVNEARSVSLTQNNKPTRIHSVALVEEAITLLPADRQQALMQTALTLYTAEYLNAIKISGSVGNVRILNILDKFSSDRDALTALSGNVRVGSEAISLETFGIEKREEPSVIELEKFSNLAVGKTINFPLSVTDATGAVQTTTITATARILPQVVSRRELLPVLNYLSRDESWKGRNQRWKAGELATIDYLTAQDINRARRKAVLTDTTGIIARATSTRNKGIIATVLSGGSGSKNMASGSVIITRSFAKEIELAMRGRFSDARARDKFFEYTGSMILMVVDPELEVFNLYFHAISEVGTYTFDDIKAAAKSTNSVDINDIMRAYSKSSMPTL